MEVNFEDRKCVFDDIVEEYEKIRPTYPKNEGYVGDISYGEKCKEIIRV